MGKLGKLGDFLSEKALYKLQEQSRVRGSVHNVGFPYRFKLPFYLFNCCLDECVKENCKECGNKSGISCDGCTKKIKEFCKGYIKKGPMEAREFLNMSSKKIGEKSTRSLPTNIIQKVKVRPYLILSSNANIIEPYIYGAPITSLKEYQSEDEKYMKLLKAQLLPTQYYLDSNVQGVSKPSYVDLSGIMPIHKNLVIAFKGYLEQKDMINISNKINLLFDLKQHSNIELNEEFINKNKELVLENKKLKESIKLLNRTKNQILTLNKDA